VSSGQLAREYGFTDLDGTRPNIWKYMEDTEERRDGERPKLEDYR
jgi:hypothetical protein